MLPIGSKKIPVGSKKTSRGKPKASHGKQKASRGKPKASRRKQKEENVLKDERCEMSQAGGMCHVEYDYKMQMAVTSIRRSSDHLVEQLRNNY